MTRTPRRDSQALARKEQDEDFATFTLRLPQSLADELAAIASDEGRSRAKQIEMALRQFVQTYRRQTAA